MMDAFISLVDAAWQLAGEDADADTVETWLALLTAQADQLQVVKDWVTGRDSIPGGVSFIRQPEEWRIPVYAFNAWREAHHPERVPRKESPDEASARLVKRRDELKARGIRNFLEVLAEEEGVSVSRIKQKLSRNKDKASHPGWMTGDTRKS